MIRRSFLATPLLSFLSRIKVEESENHLFDWTRDPHTTDPKDQNRLTPGGHNHVFLNGTEITKGVRRFQTGTDGWIEVIRYNKDGSVQVLCDELVIDKLCGSVVYVDSRGFVQ